MRMRGVVPQLGQRRRRSVEDDSLADEHKPLDYVLDRTEFVRDVEDRDPELAMKAREQLGERFLRLDVDTCGGLVECEEARLGRERLGDERSLLLPAGETSQRPVPELTEADALDRLLDRVVVAAREAAERLAGAAPRCHDLAHGRRSLDAEVRPLGQVPEPRAIAEAVGRLVEEAQLAGFDPEIDIVKDRLPREVAELDVRELDR
jgi:hypothetical protein